MPAFTSHGKPAGSVILPTVDPDSSAAIPQARVSTSVGREDSAATAPLTKGTGYPLVPIPNRSSRSWAGVCPNCRWNASRNLRVVVKPTSEAILSMSMGSGVASR